MPSLNHVTFIGRLTRDPELKYTTGGLAVATFSIAVDRRFKNQQGEKVTDFFNCTAWRQKAEFVSNYIGKGRLVCVTGSIEINDYTHPETGEKKKYTTIVCDNVDALERSRDDQGAHYAGEDAAATREQTARGRAGNTSNPTPVCQPGTRPHAFPEDDFDDSDPFADQ